MSKFKSHILVCCCDAYSVSNTNLIFCSAGSGLVKVIVNNDGRVGDTNEFQIQIIRQDNSWHFHRTGLTTHSHLAAVIIDLKNSY